MPEVDLSNYTGREQAYVKHCLLEKYLSQWSYIVGNKWDSLVYVDGFAGPWGAKDDQFRDSSFGIAINIIKDAVDGLLEKWQRPITGLCVFVEKDAGAFKKLDGFAKSNSNQKVRAIALEGEFIENIPQIEKEVRNAGKNPFKFVFLDQKGWGEAPMAKMKPFLNERSCEVLFNLMTSHIKRFLDSEEKNSSYESLYGRPGVREKICALPSELREDAAVREYCISLRQLCGFQYVSQAVIMDPKKEKVRYYLIFATNSPRGIEVFKEAEVKAAVIQDEVRHEQKIQKTGQEELMFEPGPPKSRRVTELREQYLAMAFARVKELLVSKRRVLYRELFCEAMAYPLVTPEDLLAWLRHQEPAIQFELADTGKRKKPSPLEEDFVKVNSDWL